ncbi:hypothetical protein, conserved [Trypanosoma brucei gambiense DAL972]|uniref:Uncharacterized protein n=1 Tax=Trypanosoma brucei gambiense (strain MHOM/CI/86/DAL972) TaxID=679716 RepID=C9ZWL9_TRYB9|nr:hypothetical protein, conserved [Trypanosoma brucei gambiense DAL972]CBH13808.1 hypothetical protein, conserved [Trypanosoma brucei gambiense DAL972]|eukprot:XP_011776084.1 hypothetical protein, conserved [Trypanosoma brucei gambiense DAL972]
MLRRTLWYLLEKDEPIVIRRAVMAKARPHIGGGVTSNATSSTGGTVSTSMMTSDVLSRRNGFIGSEPRSIIDRISSPNGSSVPSTSSRRSALLPSEREGGKASGDASDDAYKFLLHHIDSEIAALKRRVTTVMDQRKNVEDSQNRRIRDLFECIERPWLLLASIPPPQLPNKALDVFAKEFYTRQNGTSTSGWEEDAIFLSTCKRNWRVLTTLQRKPYEIAARRNEQTRKELKKKMSNGCSYFEKLCEQTKEWTAEMVRDEMRKAVAAKTRSSPVASKSRASSVAKKPVARRQGANKTEPKAAASKKEDKIVEVLKFEPVAKKEPKGAAGRAARGRPLKGQIKKTAKGKAPVVAKKGKTSPRPVAAKKKVKKK